MTRFVTPVFFVGVNVFTPTFFMGVNEFTPAFFMGVDKKVPRFCGSYKNQGVVCGCV